MKILSILFFLFVCTLLQGQTSLSGKITDVASGEELIAANVVFFKGDVIYASVATDFDGNYSITLDPGTYDVEATYVGYQAKKVVGVGVKAGQANTLDIQLNIEGAILLEEVTLNFHKVPEVEHDHTTPGASLTSEDIRKFASKDVTSVAAETRGLSTVSEEDGITVKGSRRTATDVSVDGKKADTSSPPKTEASFSDDAIIKSIEKGSISLKLDGSPAPAAPAPPTPSVEAGQLTAGEWKDLDNWTFWQNLLADAHFSNYQTHWNYHPQQRFSVKVSDEFGRALANIPIQLLNQDSVKVWESISDNKGGAELWGNFFGGTDSAFTLKIQQDAYEQTFRAINYTDGINSLMIQTECKASKEVDVVFVVDVTGSMGDELKYLKAEAMDLIQRAEEEIGITLRTGAVCYTDRTEDNTLRTHPFSENETETITFLQNQSLGSGGDYPEAVDLGLGHAIHNMDWNEKAIARIVFLMLDAPPHHVEEELKSLEKSIQVAAAKGIKIIPIASSGVNKETEFLLKFFAMATNGTYTFLTDHSGIGNPHIKPEAGDYNIETLNDLMVRLIEESSEYHDCAPVEQYIAEGATKKRLNKKERRDDAIKSLVKQIKCFPNPATDYVFVELQEDIDLLLITDGAGKMVQQLPQLEDGQVRIDVGSWAGGFYFFHFYRDGVHMVEKVVVSGDGGVVVKK
jgi:Carboxypeptidase regulatory-like domain/von Willebrand factor type A domain/Secretion system C-terminal sorting domain